MNAEDFTWDMYSKEHVQNLGSPLIKKFIVNELEKRKAKDVLDICCGINPIHGDFNVYCLGVNERDKRHIEHLYKIKEFYVCKMSSAFPFEDKKFDYCVSVCALHELNNKEIKNLIKEAKRVSKYKLYIGEIETYRSVFKGYHPITTLENIINKEKMITISIKEEYIPKVFIAIL